MTDLIYKFNIARKSEWAYPKEAMLQLNNPAVTNSTPQAETKVERKKKNHQAKE